MATVTFVDPERVPAADRGIDLERQFPSAVEAFGRNESLVVGG